MTDPFAQDLRRLARKVGVETHYLDMAHRRRGTSPDVLASVLRVLGYPADSPAALRDSLLRRRREEWSVGLDPVTVCQMGAPASVTFRLPDEETRGPLEFRLTLESGETRRWTVSPWRLRAVGAARIDGRRLVAVRIPLPVRLPAGYHLVSTAVSGVETETCCLSAPPRCWTPGPRTRDWGIFAPLHAIHGAESWGAGDFRDLGDLAGWTAAAGGRVVGTLPLLAAFLDGPCEPSPYSPVSRLFWNEFYVDLAEVPGFAGSEEARALVASGRLRREVASLRRSRLVDYRRQMRLKREVLEVLARRFFRGDRRGEPGFRRLLCEKPDIVDYARFRATCERRGADWRSWPGRTRVALEAGEDHDEGAADFYLFAQWAAERQVSALCERGRRLGVELYLDLPLGVHSDGYDAWRYRDLFADGASGGAPPDPVFTKGQDWGFAPIHPLALRRDRHSYFVKVIRHHLAKTGMLRIDHVMWLHRLYWVPRGFPASRGAYVRYPAEELYAILSIESHRHEAMLVGENLGTVPPIVNRAMARHAVRPMYVLQYAIEDRARRPLPTVAGGALSSLNTHDMPPWKAFIDGLDIDDRRALGLLAAAGAAAERRRRGRMLRFLVAFLRRRGLLSRRGRPGAGEVLAACLEHLGRSRAGTVLVSLEDLWLETLPQNVPGTSHERPNWRRRARLSLEGLRGSAEAAEVARRLGEARRGSRRRARG